MESAADLEDIDAAREGEERSEVDLPRGFRWLHRRAGRDGAPRGSLLEPLHRELAVSGGFQRGACGERGAGRAFFPKAFHVLEVWGPCGAELVGQLLHGWGIAMQVTENFAPPRR